MSSHFLLLLACLALTCLLVTAGGHKKVIIHVPLYVKHHHHKHTIVKHVHHKAKGGGGDDHYEVLGYTYGEPKSHGGGHWGAADESHDRSYGDSPVSFDGDHGGYSISAVGGEVGLGY